MCSHVGQCCGSSDRWLRPRPGIPGGGRVTPGRGRAQPGLAPGPRTLLWVWAVSQVVRPRAGGVHTSRGESTRHVVSPRGLQLVHCTNLSAPVPGAYPQSCPMLVGTHGPHRYANIHSTPHRPTYTQALYRLTQTPTHTDPHTHTESGQEAGPSLLPPELPANSALTLAGAANEAVRHPAPCRRRAAVSADLIRVINGAFEASVVAGSCGKASRGPLRPGPGTQGGSHGVCPRAAVSSPERGVRTPARPGCWPNR